MPILVLIFILLLTATGIATAGQEPGFERLPMWISQPGAHATREQDHLALHSGTLRTERVYSDFILRFEFRLMDANSAGHLFLRSRFGYGTPERGYRVSLTSRLEGRDSAGTVSGRSADLKEEFFSPAAPFSADEWQTCEARVDREQLTIYLNGKEVSRVTRLSEFAGYVAIQHERGDGIALRNLTLKRLPMWQEPFGAGALPVDSAGVEQPRPSKKAKPFYPHEPHDTGVAGTVGLELVVDQTGRVGDVRVRKSLHPDLDEAAVASARQWRFRPARQAGKAVAVIVTMDVSFRLNY